QLKTTQTDVTNKGLNFADNNGTVTHKNLGETLTVKGTGTKTDDQYNTSNIKTTTDSNGNLLVGIDKNATFDSLSVGGTTVNSSGLTIVNGPSITTSGINAAGTKVTNVADGTDTSDAVNKGQLNTLESEVNNKFNDLSTKGSSTQDGSGNSSTTTASGTTVTDKDGNTNSSTSTGNTVSGKDGNSTTTTADGTTSKDKDGNSNTSTATSNTLADKDGNSNTSTATSNTLAGKDGNSTTTTADGTTIKDKDGNSNTSTSTSNTITDGKNTTTTTASGTTYGSADPSDKTSTNIGQNGLSFTDASGNKTGPSVTASGIDAGNEKITNVADGTVSPTSKDAVNGSQLYTATTDLTNKGLNFADTNGTVTHKNLGETLTIKGTGTKADDQYNTDNLKTTTDSNGNIVVGLDKNATFDSLNAGGTTVNSTGLTINNGPSITTSGINAAGTKVTNVADGTDTSDAVNKGQLNTLQSEMNSKFDDLSTKGSSTQDSSGNSSSTTASGTTVTDKDGNTNSSTSTGNTVSGKDGNSTTTTADGTTTKDKDGNSNTSTATSNTLAGKDGNSTTTTADGTTIKDKDGNSNTSTSTSNTITDGKNTTTTTASGTTYGSADPSDKTSTNIGQNGLSFTDASGNKTGPSVTASGIDAGNEKITNVADGTVSPTSKDAVNGSQLYTATTDLTSKGLNFADTNGTVTHKNLGETLTIKGTGTKADDQYNTDNLKTMTDSNGNILVGLDRNASFDSLALGGTTLNSSGLTINNGPSITTSGINAAGTKVTNVANGTDAQDAVNKGQLDALATNISNNVTNVTDGNGNKVNVSSEVVNSSPNNSNTESMFLTYNTQGQETTDRLTIGQTVQKMNTEGVKYAHTNGSTDIVDGKTNDSSAGGTNSTAIGVNAVINSGADNTIALGKSTSAAGTATNSVVIGNNSSVTGASSVAIGDGAVASGTQSISVGTGNNVTGNHSGAFGDPSTITGNESYVLGNNNTVSTDNTFVVGNNVQATTVGSVVLGNNSAARTGAGVNGYVPTGATSANQSAINATTSTTGAIAVGDSQNNVYRQITGVAAGTADSDAVNVAQLKAVDDKILALKTEGNTVSDSSGNTNISNATGNTVSGNTSNGGTTTSNTSAAGTTVTAKDANGNVVNNANYSATQASLSDANGNNTTTTANGVSVTGKDSNGNTTNANYGANNAKYTNADGSSTTVGGNGVSFADKNGNATGPSITASGLDAGNQKVTNVADGAVTSTSKDAVNGSQLYSVQSQLDSLKTSGNTVTDSTGNTNQSTATGNTVKDASGNTNQTTATSNTLSGKDASGNAVSSTTTASGTNVATKDSSGNVINNANYTSTQASLSDAKGNSATTTATGTTYTGADKTSSTINNNGLSFKDASGNSTGPSVTSSGIDAGNQKVTNVANGGISSSSKDAVNGGQVYEANKSIAAALGGGAAINADGTLSSPSYNVGNTSYNNVGEALGAVSQQAENNLNQAFAYTNNRINKLEDKLSSGIAATAALEQAPYVAGKWTYAAGASYYNNQGAVGATLRRTADNGRWSMSGGVAGGNNGSPLFRVGISGVID
ncbi:beta strand repeat-containing protein, partial [Acinetobacter nectaris]|uniref:beta strand repeat-containing protein n=1 Tax=Acinetobacter nectaris TaxID=1219382 RepID=UPI001F41310F